MSRNDLFVTGSTGAIGVPLLEAGGGCHVLEGRLSEIKESVPEEIRSEIRVIVHAAAETRFNASREKLWGANVLGTESVIAFAKNCPRLERLIHLSTTCVAGDREGVIEESAIDVRPGFQNLYEESKWEAEQCVQSSGLPHSILRVATVVGSEADGSITRRGAIHHCLDWIRRGLVPMLPGTPDSRLDIIASERITLAILAAIDCDIRHLPPIAHISGGRAAPLVSEVTAELGGIFTETDTAWKRGILAVPEIVDAPTFDAFSNAVALSGDLLFQQINTATAHFLPALLHPKTYSTSAGDLLGAPSTGWRSLLRKVVEHTHK